MAMADVRIDMETALYEQMAALCAKLGTTVEAMAVRFSEEFVRMETPPVPEVLRLYERGGQNRLYCSEYSEGIQFQMTESLVRVILTRLLPSVLT